MGITDDVEPPRLKSIHGLTIVESHYPETGERKTGVFLITKDHTVFFGESDKPRRDLTLEEYQALLRHVKDEEIYPEIPRDVNLTVAPDNLEDDEEIYTKHPGLISLGDHQGADFVPMSVLDETLIMEEIHRSPHPAFVRYYGCRTQRGRITAILVEKLDQTLSQFAAAGGLQTIDKVAFCETLESAVDHLHSLGLAHNDISDLNIMIKNQQPVLIDFGSCNFFGKRLRSSGSPGWCEEDFHTSEAKHDVYSLKRLREWLNVPPKASGVLVEQTSADVTNPADA